MMEMAQAQQGGGMGQVVDPLPLLKLLAARSRCIVVVDRGAGFDALQRERALSAGTAPAGTVAPTLVAAEYMATVAVVYADAKSRQKRGGAGGLIGGLGFSQKTLEAQTLLSLTSVKTGVQEAVASGQARKKDIGILLGLFLLKLTFGGYSPTPLRVRRKPHLTRVEAETLVYLETLFPQVRVHAQVAMSALIAPANGLSNRQRLWMNRRYGQKVADFVLQEGRTGEVRLLDELDDRTHDYWKDRQRDRITAAGGYATVRRSGRARPTRATIAAAVGPVLD